MNSVADLTVTGQAADDKMGAAVAPAGDVNADGYGDAIVGAYANTASKGKAYVLNGGGTPNATADTTFIGEGADNKFGVYVY